ncbi:hypothetical protein M9H77_17540 [Catharanthus roseus]|uniref:Uncharacterized protein n=1 Tax=Catharanthus roseus TaxID=4058 RepID=A0ACC0B543_CATRO|nr:hypothetical protein M9H77_17540 [Catharanthus roseus]
MEEEHRGKVAIFEKIIQDLAWEMIGTQEGSLRGTKTLLFSKLQVEEAREISLEDLEASKPKWRRRLEPYCRRYFLCVENRWGFLLILSQGNLFLLLPSMTNFLSSLFSLEDPLMSSSVMFDPSCYGFGNLDDSSLVELNIVGFAFEFDRNSLQHVAPSPQLEEGYILWSSKAKKKMSEENLSYAMEI